MWRLVLFGINAASIKANKVCVLARCQYYLYSIWSDHFFLRCYCSPILCVGCLFLYVFFLIILKKISVNPWVFLSRFPLQQCLCRSLCPHCLCNQQIRGWEQFFSGVSNICILSFANAAVLCFSSSCLYQFPYLSLAVLPSSCLFCALSEWVY